MDIMVDSGCLKSSRLLEIVGTDGKAETWRLYEATWESGAEGGKPELIQRVFKEGPETHGSHRTVPPKCKLAWEYKVEIQIRVADMGS